MNPSACYVQIIAWQLSELEINEFDLDKLYENYDFFDKKHGVGFKAYGVGNCNEYCPNRLAMFAYENSWEDVIEAGDALEKLCEIADIKVRGSKTKTASFLTVWSYRGGLTPGGVWGPPEAYEEWLLVGEYELPEELIEKEN